MSQQTVNNSTPPYDSVKDAFDKVNANFTELYSGAMLGDEARVVDGKLQLYDRTRELWYEVYLDDGQLAVGEVGSA
jgi:hypothetical protein